MLRKAPTKRLHLPTFPIFRTEAGATANVAKMPTQGRTEGPLGHTFLTISTSQSPLRYYNVPNASPVCMLNSMSKSWHYLKVSLMSILLHKNEIVWLFRPVVVTTTGSHHCEVTGRDGCHRWTNQIRIKSHQSSVPTAHPQSSSTWSDINLSPIYQGLRQHSCRLTH